MEDESINLGVEVDADFDDFFDPFEDENIESDDDLTLDFSGQVNLDSADFGSSEPLGSEMPDSACHIKVDTRTTEEKLADLMKAMKPQRHTVLGILSMCAEPKSVAEVNAYVAEVQKYNVSVFAGDNTCAMLENAGSIQRVTENGVPYDRVEVEPVVVLDEDGVECLQPGESPEVFWQTTPEGLALIAADDAGARLRERLTQDEQFLPCYKLVLKMASTPQGATRDPMYEALEPTLEKMKPRYYSPLFAERLYKCDALEWRGAWYITELGRQCLESMSDVPDIEFFDPEDPKEK